MAFRIQITEMKKENYRETKSFITKETATDKEVTEYSERKPVFNKEYEVKEVLLERTITIDRLDQIVEELDLKAVIKAVNGV